MLPATAALSYVLSAGMVAPNGKSWFVKTERFVQGKPFPEIKPALEQHKEWVAALRENGMAITSGYRVDETGKPGGGGLMIFAAADHQAAETFVLDDPLIKAQCVEYEVNGFICDVGEVDLVDGGAWYAK